jgi:hypothetical protein
MYVSHDRKQHSKLIGLRSNILPGIRLNTGNSVISHEITVDEEHMYLSFPHSPHLQNENRDFEVVLTV